MAGTFPHPIAEAIAEAIGEEHTKIGGIPITFLRATLNPTDTAVQVDSTYKFPASGKVKVGDETIPFGSKHPTEFQATSRSQHAVLHPPGTPVFDASGIYSAIDSARSQIVIGTATGVYLDRLLRNHGLPTPAVYQDEQKRAYGKIALYPVAGRLRTIADGLSLLLKGRQESGSITAPSTLTLTLPSTWPAMVGKFVRVLTGTNVGLYRVLSISGQDAVLHPAAGPYWDSAAALVTDASVSFELVPWDVWESHDKPGMFNVDTFKFSAYIGAQGATYLQGGENAVSTDATHVTVQNTVNNVIGVWLAGDVNRSGTNYYLPGGTFAVKTLTLGTALPNANEPVIVDYGAVVSTAQLLMGPSTDGKTYYPFYLSDPGSFVGPLVDVLRAAGYLPVYTTSSI